MTLARSPENGWVLDRPGRHWQGALRVLLHEDADSLEPMSQPQALWSALADPRAPDGRVHAGRVHAGRVRGPLVARFLTCALLGGAAWGLGLRHDVAEEEYLELGQRFGAVVQVGGLGSGTLVAPQWILTAAHVPEMIQRLRRGAPLTVLLGKTEYEVDRVVTNEMREFEPDRHDIGLLHLATAVPEAIAPLELWDGDVEPGQEFVLAGWGVLARGDTGLELTPEVMTLPTRELRAGRNAVTRAEPEKSRFVACFDAPGEGLDLEAAPCVGDSGGPALIRVEDSAGSAAAWHVAGVIAAIDDGDQDRIISEYGEEFVLTSVAPYADWIRETIGE